MAAEKQAGQRLMRRTELLEKRIEVFAKRREAAEKRIEIQKARLASAILERESSQEKLGKTQALLQAHFDTEKLLHNRLQQFVKENAENTSPITGCFRLDAGFGTYENIALLIEMGYEIYIKLHNHKITQMLKSKVDEKMSWVRVGKNFKMTNKVSCLLIVVNI